MRLYTNNQGSWVGTQAEAKREFGKDWREVGVPTSKDQLLEFLNFYAVGGEKVAPIEADTPRTAPLSAKPHPLSCSANPNRYDIKDAALNSDMEHLTQAVAVWINRLEEEVFDAKV